MMFNSVGKYMPGHRDGDGCTFPDTGHFASRKPHNPQNPILTDIRRYRAARKRMNLIVKIGGWDQALQVFEEAVRRGFYVTNDWERITTPEMISHAHHVLKHLAEAEKIS